MLYIPLPSFGSNARVQGPELMIMMMSAMMAAGRMRMTLRVEGPLHGPRGAVPSAAAAQRHQQTSPRRLAGSRFLFVLQLNQSDAILQRDLHLEEALDYSSECEASYLIRIFSFFRMCGTSSNSRGF